MAFFLYARFHAAPPRPSPDHGCPAPARSSLLLIKRPRSFMPRGLNFKSKHLVSQDWSFGLARSLLDHIMCRKTKYSCTAVYIVYIAYGIVLTAAISLGSHYQLENSGALSCNSAIADSVFIYRPISQTAQLWRNEFPGIRHKRNTMAAFIFNGKLYCGCIPQISH